MFYFSLQYLLLSDKTFLFLLDFLYTLFTLT